MKLTLINLNNWHWKIKPLSFWPPNFSLGAVLMMKFAQIASKYYQQSEIIEYHNDQKVDSPSGTALATAKK